MVAEDVFDYVIIGSGFGGSVSAMRLAEKGYRVLVLEKGKRYRDQDFATSNWKVWKYLWLPVARCFGILQLSFFRNVVVLHGAGVGGGSLGYAMVLEEPLPSAFETPAWHHLQDWPTILRPHYATARRMLGVAPNPSMFPADIILHEIASSMGQGDTFRRTEVGAFFGEPGVEVPDPYFGGDGPARSGCQHCGGCMVGCRYNAKNTLVKNYLYFAEKWGAQVRPETQAADIRPLAAGQPDRARYEVIYERSTRWLRRGTGRVRARNVVVSAGVMGTLRLLFRCRDVSKSLSNLSPRLGDRVRTNSESLLGVTSRDGKTDYSRGVAITSIFNADPVTRIEPVRYPAGSGLMRFLAGPLLEVADSPLEHVGKVIWEGIRHPVDFLRLMVLHDWAKRTTIMLVMQSKDNHMRVRLGRAALTLFRRNLVSKISADDYIPPKIEIAHQVTREFARRTNGIPAGSFSEALVNVPMTAHILGGCPFGRDETEGVVDVNCQVFNYPGLYVVDNSIIPANPGVNPSLTTTALAEYAMSCIPTKGVVEKVSEVEARKAEGQTTP